MPITHADLMAITIPSDADHRRSEATQEVAARLDAILAPQSAPNGFAANAATEKCLRNLVGPVGFEPTTNGL